MKVIQKKENKKKKYSFEKDNIGVFDSFAESFKLWTKNFSIALPFIFNFIFTTLIFILFLSIIGIIFFKEYLGTDFLATLETDTTLLETLFVMPNVLYFGILITFFLLILIFIEGFFSSGAIGMSWDIIKDKNKRINLKDMLPYAKKFWFKCSLLKLIIGFFFIFISLILLLLLSLISNKVVLILLSLLIILGLAALFMFVSFSQVFLIINNSSIVQAINSSIAFTKKRYFKIIGIFLILLLLNFTGQIIPYIGFLILLLIISPIQAIVLVLYAYKNRRNI